MAVCFLIFTAGYGVLCRRIDRAPRDAPRFWVDKVSWSAQYDVVVAGDSRVNRGVWPHAMAQVLKDTRIANFGFSGVGFEARYLEAIGALLDPKSARRSIVLGVTPRSLTELAIASNGYLSWAATGRIERWTLKHSSALQVFLTPENPVLLFGRYVGNGPTYSQEEHADGWMPGGRDPEDPRASRQEYEQLFASTRLSFPAMSGLIDQVGRWVSDGVMVYMYRPPTTAATVELEDARSGFDEVAFRRRVQAAGGRWLDFPCDAYRTYDGNHLTKTAAIRFSEDLARAIVRPPKDFVKNAVSQR